MFFILPQAWDKEKILNPHEEPNLKPLDFHTLMFSISSQSLKLSISLNLFTLKTVISTNVHHHLKVQ